MVRVVRIRLVVDRMIDKKMELMVNDLAIDIDIHKEDKLRMKAVMNDYLDDLLNVQKSAFLEHKSTDCWLAEQKQMSQMTMKMSKSYVKVAPMDKSVVDAMKEAQAKTDDRTVVDAEHAK
jgi:hypothetical protein